MRELAFPLSWAMSIVRDSNLQQAVICVQLQTWPQGVNHFLKGSAPFVMQHLGFQVRWSFSYQSSRCSLPFWPFGLARIVAEVLVRWSELNAERT